MIDARYRATEVISSKIPAIKETLIEKYGIEYQDIINEKMNTMTLIPYFNTGQTNSVLSTIISHKTQEYIDEFFIKNGIEPTDENTKKYFVSHPSLKYPDYFNLQKILSYRKEKEYPPYMQETLVNCIEIMTGKKVEFRSDEFNRLIVELNKYRESYQEFLARYDEIKKEYSEIILEIETEEKNKSIIKDRYEKEYLEFIKQFMAKEDQEQLSNPFLIASTLSCYNELINYSYYSKTLYDAFTKTSFELLEGENCYARQSIVKDQIEYFNKHGIEVSADNFEEFRKSKEYQENLPDLEIVEKIIAYREQLHKKELIETLSLSPTWSNLVNKTTPLHLVDPKTDPQTELAEIILKDLTCVVTYVNDQKEIVNILLFNLAHFEEYLDNALIHEIEHVVTNLIGKKEDNEPGRSGFEIFYGDDSFRRYEQINEIINELEAQETTTMLHQKGIYILNNKENARITGGTNYERSRFLVNDFFKEYKPIIRASRIHTDINIMYEEVGKENFEALVDLVNDFVVTFSGGIFYKVMDDLDNDKKTELTEKYKEYYFKSQDILNNMREYKQKNSNALSA